MSIDRRILLLAALTAIVAIGGSLIWNNMRNKEKLEEGIKVGNVPVDFNFKDVDGESFSFSDYKGKFIVIDFMAPWCEPCKSQILVLEKVYVLPDVIVVTINVDPRYDQAFLQNFKEEYKINWNLAHSPEAGIKYEVSAVPSVILVDKGGVIVYRSYFTTLPVFQQLFEKYGG